MTELEYWKDKLYKLAFQHDLIAEYCDRLRLEIEEKYSFLNDDFKESGFKKSCENCKYGSLINGGHNHMILGYLCSINKKIGLEVLQSCKFWEDIIEDNIYDSLTKKRCIYRLKNIRRFDRYSMIPNCVEKENEILSHEIAKLMFSYILEDEITMEMLIRKQKYIFYINNNYKIIYTREVQMVFTYYRTVV